MMQALSWILALIVQQVVLMFSQGYLVILCRTEEPKIEAVIVDLQGLEHKSALQLVQEMQKEPNTKKLPVLALSIPPESAVQNELLEAGFGHIVHKPLRCTTLISGLLQTLGMQVKNHSRKANTNAKMLSGKRLLVVWLCSIPFREFWLGQASQWCV